MLELRVVLVLNFENFVVLQVSRPSEIWANRRQGFEQVCENQSIEPPSTW